MTATTLPLAAAKAAGTLLAAHACVVCRELPVRPFDPADVEEGVEYRPKKPLATASGGPRSRRCHRHTHAKKKADSLRQRTADKATRYGVPRAIQLILWVFQGCACPCGRKAAPTIPPGVTLDHVHTAPCVLRGDHPADRGCLGCVTGFVCSHCNREVIGKLEGAFRKRDDPRAEVLAALRGLVAHLEDPPLARLLRERPDLLEESA